MNSGRNCETCALKFTPDSLFTRFFVVVVTGFYVLRVYALVRTLEPNKTGNGLIFVQAI